MKRPIPPPEHYTLAEVAAMFGITRSNLNDWILRGKFQTATKGPGYKWLIAKEEVDRIWQQIQNSP